MTMLNKRTLILTTTISILAASLVLLVAGCGGQDSSNSDHIVEVSSLIETAVTPSITTLPESEKIIPPKHTGPPTITPYPTYQPTPTNWPKPTSVLQATDTPTATKVLAVEVPETIAVTATAIARADHLDRSCPDPIPRKPDYNHFFLSGKEWPTPAPGRSEHFWLTKPLPGGGRFLYTDWLPYGYDAGGRYLIHNGIDSAEPEGTPVLAVADGTVVVAGEDISRLYGWRCNWYGHLVVVELDDQWLNQPVYVLYGHILNISVVVGQRVQRGDQVAEVGHGGAAQLAHLHFEVRVGTNSFGSTRNPLLWLAPPVSRGVIVGRLVDPEGRPWQGVTVVAVGQTPNKETYTTWTYLDDPKHIIRPDELYAENFAIGDVLPGEYKLYVELQDETYQVPITVSGGSLTEVEIVTKPFKAVDQLREQ